MNRERLVIYIPSDISERLKREAKRRMAQMNLHGTIGTNTAELLCLLIEEHFGKVCELSEREYKERIVALRAKLEED